MLEDECLEDALKLFKQCSIFRIIQYWLDRADAVGSSVINGGEARRSIQGMTRLANNVKNAFKIYEANISFPLRLTENGPSHVFGTFKLTP